jgi:hypothetical protein
MGGDKNDELWTFLTNFSKLFYRPKFVDFSWRFKKIGEFIENKKNINLQT